MQANLLPNNSLKLHLHSRGHVEALARHIFRNDPVGLAKVDREFGENKVIQPELREPKHRDYVMHHIPQ
jgi:hypothetical protein